MMRRPWHGFGGQQKGDTRTHRLSSPAAMASGRGTPKDSEEAAAWFRRAAEAGHIESQLILGNCYAKGDMVAQDYFQAVVWLRRAADAGSADAQINLGICYAKGNGVPADRAQAIAWIRRAAESGGASARQLLERLEAGDIVC